MPSTSDAPLTPIIGFSHFVMRVRDLARSLDYYERLFGFRIYSDRRDVSVAGGSPTVVGVMGGTAIELIETKTEGVRRERDEPGYACVAFAVADAAAALETLRARGLTRYPEVSTIPGGHKAILFRDPDGNVLELIEVLGGPSLSEVASRGLAAIAV